MSDIIETETSMRGRKPSTDVVEAAEPPTWILYILPNGKRAQISCSLGGTSRMRDLEGRLARLIVLLQRAYVEDENLPDNLRGFRNAAQLAKAYDEDRKVTPPLKSTITTYAYKLCKILDAPAPAREPFPPLILRVKNSGARLLYPVEIKLMGFTPGDAPKPAGGERA